MDATMKQHNWAMFLKLFSKQNSRRSTRLGVFEGEPGAMTELWIEDDLPLAGIDLDDSDEQSPTIEIMLGVAAKEHGSRHLTHMVAGARFVKIVLSADGEADGLDIEDSQGKTTVLRFEN